MSESLSSVVKNIPVLDLRYIKSEEDLNGLTSIENVGLIMVPEEFMGVVSRVQQSNVGCVFPVSKDDKSKLKVIAGQLQISCDAFSKPDELVVIVGMIVVTPPAAEIKSRIVIAGQVLIPEEMRSQITAAVISLVGQVGYYKGKSVYTVMSEESFGRDFFEALDESVTLVNYGPMTIEDDVTVDLFKSKVTDLAIYSPVVVPPQLKAIVQSRATQKLGPIAVKE